MKLIVGFWGVMIINVGLIVLVIIFWFFWMMLLVEMMMLVVEDKVMLKVWGKFNVKKVLMVLLMIIGVL